MTERLRKDVVQYAETSATRPFLRMALEDAQTRQLHFLTDSTGTLHVRIAGLLSTSEALSTLARSLLDELYRRGTGDIPSIVGGLSIQALALSQLQDAQDQERAVTEQALARIQPVLLELILCRSADNFLAYVTELLTLILRHKPQMLKAAESGELPESIPLALILPSQDMNDLVREIVERRVDQLSRRSTRDLLKYVKKRLGFALFERTEDADKLVRIVETRNLIGHNRAVVNRLFKAKLPSSPVGLGEILEFNTQEVFADLDFLLRAAESIDMRAVKQFKLPLRSDIVAATDE